MLELLALLCLHIFAVFNNCGGLSAKCDISLLFVAGLVVSVLLFSLGGKVGLLFGCGVLAFFFVLGLLSRCRLGGITLLLALLLEEIVEVGLGGFFVAHSLWYLRPLGRVGSV